METHVDVDLIRQLAKNIAKDIKTEADLGDFSKLLKKIVVETALGAELTEHLGYDKNNPKGNGSGNSRCLSASNGLQTPILIQQSPAFDLFLEFIKRNVSVNRASNAFSSIPTLEYLAVEYSEFFIW